MRIICLVLIFTFTACNKNNARQPQAVDAFTESTSTDFIDDVVVTPAQQELACIDSESSEFATNTPLTLNGRTYPADTHLTITRGEDGSFKAIAHLNDNSGAESDEFGSYDFLDLGSQEIGCDQITSIPVTEDENGDMQLGEYSLPVDILVAGKEKPRKRKKKGGTTYCYREVKRIVKNKITLTGVAAYMANSQLKKAGWKRYSNYNSAPKGSVCVFNKGGKVTSSGGHKYGHIGIKGRTGVIDPSVGFKLNRPFLGCYYKA